MKRKISKIFGVGLALVLVLSLSLVAAAPVAADISNVGTEPDLTTFTPQNVTPATTDAYTVVVTDTGFFDTGTGVKVVIQIPTVSGLAAFVVAPGSLTVTETVGTADDTLTVAGGGIDGNGNFTTITVDMTAVGAVTDGSELTITFNASSPASEGSYDWDVDMTGGTGSDTDTGTVTVDGTVPTIPAANIVGSTFPAPHTIQITFSEPVFPTGTWDDGTLEIASITMKKAGETDIPLILPAAAGGFYVIDGSNQILTITLATIGTVQDYLVNGWTLSVDPDDANTITDAAGNLLSIAVVDGTTAIIGDSIAPVIPQNLIVGDTAPVGADTITITFSEEVLVVDGTWDTNEWTSIESPDGTAVDLTGAASVYTTGTFVLVITLAGDYLTNGDVIAVTPAAYVAGTSGITDLAGNPLAAVEVVGTVPNTGDTTAPTIVIGAGTAFTTDTTMAVTFNENLKAVDATKFSSTSFTVVDASIDGTNLALVNVTISGLSQPDQTGGVTGAAGLQLDDEAVTDTAGNNLAAIANQTVAGDITAPTVTSATLDYNDGTLVITCNEKIDADPVGNVALGNIAISNTLGAPGSQDVVLTGATITASEATTVTITLTEAQRVAALALSGVNGGDGGAVYLDVGAGAVQDMATQANANDWGNPVTETPDTTKPAVDTVTAPTLNYGTGVLVITCSETIDADPATNVDLTKIYLSETAGSYDVVLTGATVTVAEATTVTITLTAAQKADVLAIAPVFLDVEADALLDMTGVNTNDLDEGNAVTETADTTAPILATNDPIQLTSATNIDVIFDEAMGAVAADGSEFTSAGGSWTATAAAIDSEDQTIVHVTVSGIDAAEERGIAGDMNITQSALADVAGVAFGGIAGQDIADAILPTFTIAYYTDLALTIPFTGEYMNTTDSPYYIVVTSSEPLAAAPTIDIDAEGTANDDVGGTTTGVGGNDYRYLRNVLFDAVAFGDVAEVILITATDAPTVPLPFAGANVATDADVTDEKKIDAATPQPTLSSPANASAVSDDTPTFVWNEVTDNNSPVTYLLQVDDEITFTAPFVVNETGLTVTEYSQPTSLIPGTYYWQVTATDSLDNTSAASDIWSFVLDVDRTAPTVVVTSPNGGESWESGSSQLISWTASDDVTLPGNLSIGLYYSTNGGTDWTEIATGEANDGAYLWTVASVDSSDCLVKVEATDEADIVGSDVSNAVFAIYTPAAFTWANLSVTPTSGDAPLAITASAEVTNTGGVSGDCTAELKVDGTVVGSQTVPVAAGATEIVSFEYELTDPGTYQVTIDELTAAEVTVSEVAVTLESIAASPSEVSLLVDGTQQLTVTATYDDANTAVVTATSTYVSVPETVATVSTGGFITAVAEGSATVTVSYTEGGVTETDTVSVTVSGVFDPMVYDEDEDGVISKSEAVAALMDYLLDGSITKANAVEVLILYLGI